MFSGVPLPVSRQWFGERGIYPDRDVREEDPSKLFQMLLQSGNSVPFLTLGCYTSHLRFQLQRTSLCFRLRSKEAFIESKESYLPLPPGVALPKAGSNHGVHKVPCLQHPQHSALKAMKVIPNSSQALSTPILIFFLGSTLEQMRTVRKMSPNLSLTQKVSWRHCLTGCCCSKRVSSNQRECLLFSSTHPTVDCRRIWAMLYFTKDSVFQLLQQLGM